MPSSRIQMLSSCSPGVVTSIVARTLSMVLLRQPQLPENFVIRSALDWPIPFKPTCSELS